MVKNFLKQTSLILTALFLAAALLLPTISLAVQLERHVLPVEQQLELILDADQTDYSGSVKIALKVVTPVSSFQFHSEEITIEQLVLTQNDQKIETSFNHVGKDLIEVHTSENLKPGDYLLSIDFSNEFDTRAISLYRMESEGAAYVFSQMESTDARKAFPCWDEPSFKIPFELTLTIPKQHMAVSNTAVVDEQLSDGWKTVRFKKSKPMSTYFLTIATGPLESIEMPGLGIPARIITPQGKTNLVSLALESTPPILAALERYFDSKYPYEKLDYIAVPEFWPGAMENAGAITFSAGVLLIDSKSVTLGQKRRQASVIAHELAHMWFGDLVTMTWWDDLWLNESFATWMADKIVEEVFPEYQMGISSLNTANFAMGGDARPSTNPIRTEVDDPGNLLQNIGSIYYKGSAMLRMFEDYVGPDKFRQGILDYINENAWGNAVAADLYQAIEKNSSKSLTEAIITFTDQPGIPLVGLESLGNNRVRLTQKRFSNYGVEIDGDYLWQIPVKLKIKNGDNITYQQVMLDKSSLEFSLDIDGQPEWILPNADIGSYFRWIAPPEMLLAMATGATDNLSIRERIGFIQNSSALLDAGALSGDDYLKIIKRFSTDPEPQVVSSVISALGKVERAFVPDSLNQQFSVYVRHTLGPAIKRFKREAQPNEAEIVSSMRPRLIGWLADEGNDSAIVSYLEGLADNFLEDPNSVDPALIGVAIAVKCRKGDHTLYEDIKSRFETAEIPRQRAIFLSAMGAFNNDEIIEDALKYNLSGHLRPQERFSITRSIGSISTDREKQVFEWMLTNYDSLIQLIPPVYIPFMASIGSGCSHEKLAKTKTFLSDPSRTTPGLVQRLVQVSEQVNDCVSLRDREGKAVAEYLRKLSY